MTAAPSNLRFVTRIAPEGKKGLYMGYSNFTVGIGWKVRFTPKADEHSATAQIL